jgi:endonuclease/exonuclease/phosphatase family metal-dependent hydrolase
MLVRTWNLFHGNTVPPGRKAYLREMVELITADKPDVVCLQEIPAWALGSVGEWSGMQTVTARARGSKLGPIPIPASFGHTLTNINHGVLRSAFAGQGNAILFPTDATVRSLKTITLNTNVYCEERGEKLGLDRKLVRVWEKERRVCHVVHYELPDRRRFMIANLHATSYPVDPRLADAELLRATRFVERSGEVDEVMVVAGDFNITREQSETIEALLTAPPEARWVDVGPQIDHVLLRQASVVSVRVWPDEERMYDGRLLSDHAPVEVEVGPRR